MTKNNEQITICDFCGARDCLITHCKIGSIFKRKKQECEELKSTNKIYEQGIARLKDKKNNLKKENNSLKETIDGLLSIQYKLADNCVKYNQTVAEIKEICNSVWGNGLDEEIDKFDLILHKINEVIDD